MKTIKLLFLVLFISSLSFSQTVELPFFDDFEEIIINDATFQNWTTENLEGWHYWHMVTYQGVNGSQCMRFENTDVVQNDWLITNPINCAGAENLKVNFSHFYHTNTVPPKLYYTNQYNGNASQSAWTELSYSFGANENQWYSSEDFIIENPDDVLYFAFHYEAAANEGAYFLLDNFSVKEYIPITPFNLVGTSEHFEFYTNISGEENFYQEIESALEAKYLNYVSLWQRPDFESIFKTDSKIKVKYCSRNDVLSLGKEMADWDCGSFDFSNNTIFISPLTSEIQQNYYTDLSSLSVNELSQLALAGKLYNDGDVNYQVWYLEGFGLYEMGYRPNRNDLISKLNGLGTNEPGIESVTDLQLLNETGNKDLMASLFESKVLVGCYYYLSTWHNSYDWHMLLKHYYIQEGSERIRLIYSTENFDFYGNENEIPSIADLANDMETQFALQESRFDIQINHRINICIYEVPVGLEMTNRTDFQGVGNGADLIEVTPHRESGIYGLLHHEFMHMMVNILSNHNPGPGQFLNEGLASFTDGPMPEEHKPAHRYKIQDLFYHYQRKYNREPTWLEIVDNTEVNEEDGFWVDAYALGFMYWSYMYEKYPDGFWVKVKLFMQSGRDWTVFGGKTTQQEGAEFIQFMKELAFVGPPLEATLLPFYEDFEIGFDGWTLMRYGANDLWKIEENAGIEESYCAYVVDPYWLEEKNVDSWLVSPPIDCGEVKIVNVQFNYKQHGQGIKPEVYYAGNFTGAVAPIDWILVEGISWDAPEGEWSEISFNIDNAPNKLNIGVRYLSNEGNYTTYLIDNFRISAIQLPISLEEKIFLQGPYDTGTGLMRDDLRSKGLIEITSPYADDLTCNANVFTVTGADAIVDWVWVELRDSRDGTTVIASRSALLQADGDVVDTDGVSPVTIDIAAGNYYLMLSHRNHLGILTASTVSLTGGVFSIDLTSNSTLVLGGTNGIATMGDGKFALYAGDFNGDGQVQNTDKNAVEPLRGISGYSNADLDMNGEVQNTDLNSVLNPNLGKGKQYTGKQLYAKRKKKLLNKNI